MPFFIVEAYADDCKVTANHWSAQMAFADAVDWRLVKRLSNVAISDGIHVYSIREFATALKQPDAFENGIAAPGEEP
jgi:hypothetical protein